MMVTRYITSCLTEIPLFNSYLFSEPDIGPILFIYERWIDIFVLFQKVGLVLSHNFGLSTVEEGEIEEDEKVLDLNTSYIGQYQNI